MDLTTLARVKTYLEAGRENMVSTTADSMLSELITLYSLQAEKYLCRYVQTTARTEYHDVEPRQYVFALRAYPVSSVTSIYHDTTREWTTGEIDSDNYSVENSSGVLVVDGHALIGSAQSLRVVYTGGMAPTAASFVVAYPDVAGAVDLQVIHHWQRRLQIGGSSMQAGQGSAQYQAPLNWLPMAREILGSHRRYGGV